MEWPQAPQPLKLLYRRGRPKNGERAQKPNHHSQTNFCDFQYRRSTNTPTGGGDTVHRSQPQAMGVAPSSAKQDPQTGKTTKKAGTRSLHSKRSPREDTPIPRSNLPKLCVHLIRIGQSFRFLKFRRIGCILSGCSWFQLGLSVRKQRLSTR